jgi:hypothetical protein
LVRDGVMVIAMGSNRRARFDPGTCDAARLR